MIAIKMKTFLFLCLKQTIWYRLTTNTKLFWQTHINRGAWWNEKYVVIRLIPKEQKNNTLMRIDTSNATQKQHEKDQNKLVAAAVLFFLLLVSTYMKRGILFVLNSRML